MVKDQVAAKAIAEAEATDFGILVSSNAPLARLNGALRLSGAGPIARSDHFLDSFLKHINQSRQ